MTRIAPLAAAPWRRNLLWTDAAAGAVAGVFVLVASAWLSRLEGVPRDVLVATGAANVLYAAFAFALARRRDRPRSLVVALAAANVAWGVVCGVLLAAVWESVTAFGVLHLGGEAILVSGLGLVEWQNRAVLAPEGGPGG